MIRKIETSPFHRVFKEEVFRRDVLAGGLLARMVASYIVECPGGHPGLTAQLVHHCCQHVPDCWCNFVARVYQTGAPLLSRCTKLVYFCCRGVPYWCTIVCHTRQPVIDMRQTEQKLLSMPVSQSSFV